MRPSTGFPPIADVSAKVLILGSLPGVRSIEARQYYAHPQNAFWRIMGELFTAGPEVSYERRKELLIANHIAVWDVLASSVRRGSLDSRIDLSTAAPNDFPSFLGTCSAIRNVFFNGRTAATLFRKLVASDHPEIDRILTYRTLPSTSAAFASISFEVKLEKWSIVSE